MERYYVLSVYGIEKEFDDYESAEQYLLSCEDADDLWISSDEDVSPNPEDSVCWDDLYGDDIYHYRLI